jgi:hypothetical protein
MTSAFVFLLDSENYIEDQNAYTYETSPPISKKLQYIYRRNPSPNLVGRIQPVSQRYKQLHSI